MIIASTDHDDGSKGWLIGIPFDEVQEAITQGRGLEATGPDMPAFLVIFGPTHRDLVGLIQQRARGVSGIENVEGV